MSLLKRKLVLDVEPETVVAAISRLETLTDRIQATAAVLEQLIARLRAEEEIENDGRIAPG